MSTFLARDSIPVRWVDMDAIGHVNNSVYFTYMEQIRINWISSIVGDFSDSDTGPVIANASCQFLKAVEFPDQLQLELSANKPGRSSLLLKYQIFSEQQQQIVANGETLLVWINFKQKKSTPLPEMITQLFKKS